ncbi:hypothetical protein KR018_008655 [Drosophila ironensis]|nr:hypothetical protein KR018_008655 [Drosophila ironensis]
MHDNPWMVMVIENGRSICGGSLIHPYYVLTAGHCVGNGRIVVRLGEYDLTQKLDCDSTGSICLPRPQEFNVVKWFGWNQNYLENDIALLRLGEAVQYRENIKPICVILGASREMRWKYLQDVSHFKVTGWGSNGYSTASMLLQQTTLVHLHPSYCSIKLDTFVDNRHICGASAYSSTCTGDSGGPLSARLSLADGRQRTVLFGVVSYGLNTCDGPTVFANVLAYSDWIQSVIYGG